MVAKNITCGSSTNKLLPFQPPPPSLSPLPPPTTTSWHLQSPFNCHQPPKQWWQQCHVTMSPPDKWQWWAATTWLINRYAMPWQRWHMSLLWFTVIEGSNVPVCEGSWYQVISYSTDPYISSSQVVTQSYILSSHVCHNYLFYILPLCLHLQPEYRLHDSLPSSTKEQVTRSVVICDYLKRAHVSLPYALIVFSPSYSCVGIHYTPLQHSERRESAMLMAFQSISSNSHSMILIFLSFRLLNKVITPLHKAFTQFSSPDSFVVSYKKPESHHYLITASYTVLPLFFSHLRSSSHITNGDMANNNCQTTTRHGWTTTIHGPTMNDNDTWMDNDTVACQWTCHIVQTVMMDVIVAVRTNPGEDCTSPSLFFSHLGTVERWWHVDECWWYTDGWRQHTDGQHGGRYLNLCTNQVDHITSI